MEVKKLPVYAKTDSSYLVVNFVEGKGFVATTNIHKCLSSVTIEYDYNYAETTFNEKSFASISKKEFYDAVHKIQRDNKIKFTIKTK